MRTSFWYFVITKHKYILNLLGQEAFFIRSLTRDLSLITALSVPWSLFNSCFLLNLCIGFGIQEVWKRLRPLICHRMLQAWFYQRMAMYSLPHMGKQYHFGIQKGEVKAGGKKDLKPPLRQQYNSYFYDMYTLIFLGKQLSHFACLAKAASCSP